MTSVQCSVERMVLRLGIDLKEWAASDPMPQRFLAEAVKMATDDAGCDTFTFDYVMRRIGELAALSERAERRGYDETHAWHYSDDIRNKRPGPSNPYGIETQPVAHHAWVRGVGRASDEFVAELIEGIGTPGRPA
ncbi:hypothetical protein [Microvirga tunisiensis]|uniref:Uncharacterized protein n=1 Tax=Microvirga tunisiensis TaxID=2108360 RepID=A0A5N7MG69_9HYPH|nr:hypothetical protein [Microvirga tunisiensis]MPR06205.1 hypothetical protein [Microvirga tunisiensis]MPR26052.1 hypothetical protein [Microvirga tunisiensis]